MTTHDTHMALAQEAHDAETEADQDALAAQESDAVRRLMASDGSSPKFTWCACEDGWHRWVDHGSWWAAVADADADRRLDYDAGLHDRSHVIMRLTLAVVR